MPGKLSKLRYFLLEKRYFAPRTPVEFIDPTPGDIRRYRTQVIAAGVVVVLLYLGLKAYVAPRWHAMSVCEQLPWDRAMLIVALLSPLLFPLLELPRTLRRLRAGQSPGPGERIVRRTRVVRGRSLRISASMVLAASLVCIAISLWGLYRLKATPVFLSVAACGEASKD